MLVHGNGLKGLYLQQVGRESPADIVVAVPTVSTRHAMLRLGDGLTITSISCQHEIVFADTALPLKLDSMQFCLKLFSLPLKPEQTRKAH